LRKEDKTRKRMSVCDGCEKREDFSFGGCMKNCQKFMSHLQEVAAQNGSPCLDYRCGVPGVNNNHREKCEICPIRKAYSAGVKKSSKGSKCVLGKKDPIPYLSKWELEREYYYRGQ